MNSYFKRSSQIASVVCWLAFVWVAFKYMRHFIHEPDIWWHLASGREMFSNHTFLRHDIFSHTFFGHEWINFEWLSHIFLFALMKTAGISGIFVWKVIMGCTAVAAVWFLARERGARGPLLYLLTWLAYHVLQVRLCTRVELFTFNLLPLFLAFVLIGRTSDSEKTRQRLLFGFFVLMVLWTNLHAGFIAGLALLIGANLGARWSGENKSFVSFLDHAVTLSLIAMLINPFGPKLINVFLVVGFDFRTVPGLIAEWAKPSVQTTPYFWLLFVVCALQIVRDLLSGRKELRFWIPIVFLFMLYGTRYYRSTALLACVAIPYLAESLANWESRCSLRWRDAAVGVVWLLAFGTLYIDSDFLTKPLPPGIVDWKLYPVGSCQFIKDHDINGRMYNTMAFGGYIDWALGPQRKVFMDGRYFFFPLIAEEQRLMNNVGVSEQSWKSFFAKYGVDHAVVRYETQRLPKTASDLYPRVILDVMFPSSSWALVYWDDASLLFLKRTPDRSAIIRQYEYKFVRPYNAEETFYAIDKNHNGESILIELQRNKNETKLNHRCSWLMRLGLTQR